MRRCVALWLCRWPTDRWKNRQPPSAEAEAHKPLVMTIAAPGGLQVAAVDANAAAEGLKPGMALTHARALIPHLRAEPLDVEDDAAALKRLAVWCTRYTPFAAPDGTDSVMLDITGCAHLFGGEAALLRDMVTRLRRFGIVARAACADTPAAAWAWSRHGKGTPIIAVGATKTATASLPLAALRIPDTTVAGLERLGLCKLDDLFGLPRAPLARRYGVDLPRRIDQLLGREAEPISPLLPAPVWQTKLQFPEPIVHSDGVEIALDRLLARLCELLRKADQGARDLTFTLGRVDCTAQHVSIGTSRAVRDAKHLRRLFMEKLDRIDAGFGIETATLAATRVEGFVVTQGDLDAGHTDDTLDAGAAERVWALVDRIENRFGAQRIRQVAAVASHLPERSVCDEPVRRLAASGAATWPRQSQRPLSLLASPEPITALAPVPDHPPLTFTWRHVMHKVAHAEGPERIDPEWWRLAQSLPDRRRTRDYYRVEDSEGRRFWLFREGLYGHEPAPRWFMHGVFG